MNLVYKRVSESYPNKLNELDKNINVNLVFKHLLKCESCLWNITFYESTGYISVDSKKIDCPKCKERDEFCKNKNHLIIFVDIKIKYRISLLQKIK